MTLQVCYQNNGLPSPDVPCDPNAATSACCGVDGVCVSNLNCIDSSGGSVPGTCTDQGWGSLPNPACPCPARYINANVTLDYHDSVTFCPDGRVCCGYQNNACCAAGQGHAQIVYGQAATIPASTGTALSAYYSGVKVSTLSISPSASSAKTTSRSSSPPATSATASSSTAAAQGLSSGAKIGIGVGVGPGGLLLIAITIAITYFCFKRRYKYTTQFQAGKEMPDYQGATGYQGLHTKAELPPGSGPSRQELQVDNSGMPMELHT